MPKAPTTPQPEPQAPENVAEGFTFTPTAIAGPTRQAKPNRFLDAVRSLADSDKRNTEQGLIFETNEKFSVIRSQLQRAGDECNVTVYVHKGHDVAGKDGVYGVSFRVADKVRKGFRSDANAND